MREISEEYYFAGWYINLEYELWDIITKEESPKNPHKKPIWNRYRDQLLQLSKEANGWWIWNKLSDEELHQYFELNIVPDCSKFISLDDWQKRFSKWDPSSEF